MIAPAKPEPDEPEKPGGRGDGPYLWPAEHNRIIRMMLNPRRRWKLTKAAKADAMATTMNNLADDDGRVRNSAVANLLKMERQNQADDHKLIDKIQPDQESITNQQINIYLPENGRERRIEGAGTNGYSGNGKH
jgi:hypothetical protein